MKIFRSILRSSLCSNNNVYRSSSLILLPIKNLSIYEYKHVNINSSIRRMMSSNSTENNKDNNTDNNNNNNNNNNEKSQTDSSSNQDQEILQKLQKEIKDLKDQVIRSYAEEENVRRIAKRDVENAKSYANEKMAKAMLDVADNLDRALAAIPIEERTNSTTEPNTLTTFIEGITMTEKNLQKIFIQFNIIKYGQVGDIFNPSLHDALFQIPDASKESGTIGQVLKSGYKLKDRVIRAAQVGTFVKPT